MKKQILTIALSSSALLACMAGTAAADSFSAAASYDLGGTTDAAANGAVSVDSGFISFGNVAFGPEGWGEGAASAASSELNGAAANSGVEANFYDQYNAGDAFADSSAFWEMDFEALVTGNYSWEAFVPGAGLSVSEVDGGEGGPAFTSLNSSPATESHAELSGVLKVNGGDVNSFGATLGSSSGLATSGVMPGPDFFNDFGSEKNAGWSPFSFTTPLGHFTAGDTITITYMLTTHSHILGTASDFFPESNYGFAFARLGDPGQLGGPGGEFITGELTGIADPTTNPVPEPGTMLLLGTGLAGLAGMRRRKKQKE